MKVCVGLVGFERPAITFFGSMRAYGLGICEGGRIDGPEGLERG